MQLSVGFLTPEYISPQRLDGGLANYLHKVASELIKRNHLATIFVLSDRNGQWKDGKINVIEVKRAKPLKLPRWLKDKLERFEPVINEIRSAKRIEKAVWRYHRSLPLDILHTTSYSAPGYTLRRNGRIPVVCRVSSYSPLLRSAYGSTRHFADYLTDWLEIRQVLDADAAFVPSKFIAETYKRLENFAPDILRTPLDSTNLEVDESLYRSHFANYPYFLYFGTLSAIKGADLLGEAIPNILQRHPEIHFVLIGRDDGMPNCPKVIDYLLAKCKGFENHIHYMAPVSKSYLYPVISHAIAVVMPSRADNYPNACLEAQRLEVPVIGTYGSSLEEMIIDGVTGLLVENGNPEKLASAMIRMIEMPVECHTEMKNRIHDLAEAIGKEDRIEQLICFYIRTIENFKSRV